MTYLLTSVSAVGLVSALCLNLSIQTVGRFVLGVIVPIPPHTRNISSNKEIGDFMKKLLLWAMALFISVCYASEEVNIFNISGKYICSTEINYPEKSGDILVVNSNFLFELGKCGSQLSNGIYIVSKSKNSNVLNQNKLNRDFGYEDVTSEYLPIEEWDAGDIEVADLNGDGKMDIVFSINYYDEILDSRPRIWIQTPTGNFIDETDIRFPALQAPCNDIELFDIDSDNDIDIFLTGYSSSSYYLPAGLLVNDGTGIFTDESTERLPQFIYPNFVFFAEAANLDSNQSIDLIVNVFSEPDTITYQSIIPEIWMNNGSGYFIQDSQGRLPNTDNYGFFELITTDVDNNSLCDIIFANTESIIYDNFGNIITILSGRNACFLNNGDGFYSDETVLRMPEQDDTSTRDLAIDDIDNDGDLDILEVGMGFDPLCQQVRLLTNNGNGFYNVSYGSLPYLSGWFNDSQFGLLDDDEFPDLFMIRVQLGEPYMDILLTNNGDGTFIDTSSLLPSVLDFSVSCALFDHQIDNDIDILIANTGYLVGEFDQNLLYHNSLNPTSIEDYSITNPSIYVLSQNYPNPFNPTTTIEFSIQNDSNIELSIYNIKGQKIKQLLNDHKSPGNHSIVWDGDDNNKKPVSSGIYYYKLSINGKTVAVTKCLLLK